MTTITQDTGAALAPNLQLGVAGETLAYRRIGTPSATLPPLVLLQHFRGNLDYWDPALLDVLAADREVITVDLPGVGRSTGTTPDNVTDMARGALRFLDALDLTTVDLLGFSLGGHIAQEIALIRPRLPRRLVLAAPPPKAHRICTAGPTTSSPTHAVTPSPRRTSSPCSSPDRTPASSAAGNTWPAPTPAPRTATSRPRWPAATPNIRRS
ncbi:alpha/beta fold hydrolase [Mycolicibacterium sp.]|uniref:alpha/beta fold hydrolase n=1 Tax=Mycolicibacterium sp. TaxID=2320850 RepID=UPI0025EF40F9|nr:alpha/beta fold hydrolase [Mycolicibacterium sp.]